MPNEHPVERPLTHQKRDLQPSAAGLASWPTTTAVNVGLCLLWSAFAWATFARWLRDQNPTGLGVFVVNSVFAWLFLTREPCKCYTRRREDWWLAGLAVALSFSFRPTFHVHGSRYAATVVLQCVGAALVAYCALCLGRSFGVVPALRTVRTDGAYQIVRHPLYSSELLLYVGFCVGNVSLRNLCVLTALCAALYGRAVAEERLLLQAPEYVAYVRATPCRLVPGVF